MDGLLCVKAAGLPVALRDNRGICLRDIMEKSRQYGMNSNKLKILRGVELLSRGGFYGL